MNKEQGTRNKEPQTPSWNVAAARQRRRGSGEASRPRSGVLLNSELAVSCSLFLVHDR